MSRKPYSRPASIQVMRFMARNVHLCVDLSYVKKVLPLAALEKIPNSPEFLVGLLNLAGIGVPIIDLALRLGLTRNKKYSVDTPILLCLNENKEVGFIIDELIGLFTLPGSALQIPDEFKDNTQPFTGALEIDTKLYLLINIPDLMNSHSEYNIKGLNIINKATLT